MALYVTGDIHGPIDIGKLSGRSWPEGKGLSRSDLVIVCGDFGMPWDGSNEERYWLSWLNDRSWTTLFVDGNHECYPYLADLPVTERWGGKVQVYPDYPHIIHLMRGQVYDLPTGDPCGSSARVFCMGGASSHDKQWRTPGVSWWPEELPNHKEYHEAERNLEAAGWRVDFVVSHCCPGRLLPRALDAAGRMDDPGSYVWDMLNEWFDLVDERLSFTCWYCGHYHVDAVLDEKHLVLYRDVLRMA